MRFALLGDHPDGIDMACALAECGRHRLLAYTAALSTEVLARLGGEARRVSDVEEVLADPAIEVVIVAGHAGVRPAQLRRALQSERHVLCVHPPDQTPEIAYEAAMIRNDTGCVLLPLLPEATHPAIRRLAEFVRRKDGDNSPIGAFRMLEIERGAQGEVLEGIWIAGHKPSFPGWDILRTLGGEIQEVWAFAEQEELREGEPVLVAGRFEQGGLFHVRLLPHERQPKWRLTAIGSDGRVELLFPLGWNGPAILDWRDAGGEAHEEYWQQWDPWPVLIDTFEQMVAAAPRSAGETPALRWQDAIRALELDDAARRGVEKRRSSLLEYQEATEEVGFKGTMTLVGCSLLWGVLLLLILSVWWPKLGFLIVPLIVVFLGLQFLRYIVPSVSDASQKRR
ncbi:MAG TPA: Gfo/Idh/MocA family oxidoreductase [Gemmataceae bacterium]|nr:Gfo/Idh/MocA family oxidoreductase [Gemmataceae bacterium]